MTDAREEIFLIGTDGEWITDQPGGPLDTAPANAATKTLNTHFADHVNLRVRKGSRDAFYNETDGTRIVHRNICNIPDKTYADIIQYNRGVKGLGRFAYVDNRNIKTEYDLDYYTLFALQDVPDTEFPQTHTYTWRNPLAPQINQLEFPTLPRPLYPDAFSDVNIFGAQRACFWNYVTVPWGGDRESYLLGTYGGRRNRPPGNPITGWAEPPLHWDRHCSGAGTGSGSGSYGLQYSTIDRQCYQRRVLFWSPRWGEWLQSVWPAAPPQMPNAGPYYWQAPFVWYWDPANPSNYYFEPCGRFLEYFNNSLFMARIERTVMHGGVPTWEYKPSYVMWSWANMPTAMGLGTPPTYPFYMPDEPGKRPWWDIRESGIRNPRTAYIAGEGAINGMTKWAGRLFLTKTSGFTEIRGSYHGDFAPYNFEWTNQGPTGPYAWSRNAPEGIYYVTRDGLFLFDGNPASYNKNMASPKVRDIFNQHIDWGNSTDFESDETISPVCFYRPQTKEIIINFAKKGEQGAGTDLPRGTPTHQMVFDTETARFTEWALRLYNDTYTAPIKYSTPVGPGLMLAGERPVEDGYVLMSHPINGNAGRILYQADVGHQDAMEMKADGSEDTDTGYAIPIDVHTKTYTLDEMKSKAAMHCHRTMVYALLSTFNAEKIKRKIVYDHLRTYTSDDAENPEFPLEFNSETDFIQESEVVHKEKFSAISVGWYHDEVDIHAIRLAFTGMVTMPVKGDTLTQVGTGATLLVIESDLAAGTVTGYSDGGFDFVNNITSDNAGGVVMNPAAIPPDSATVIANPLDTLPKATIVFVQHSMEVSRVEGDARKG